MGTPVVCFINLPIVHRSFAVRHDDWTKDESKAMVARRELASFYRDREDETEYNEWEFDDEYDDTYDGVGFDAGTIAENPTDSIRLQKLALNTSR